MNEVIPAFKENVNFWVAFPKPSSKIISDLNRDYKWGYLENLTFEIYKKIDLDHVWGAYRFVKKDLIPTLDLEKTIQTTTLSGTESEYKVTIPFELEKLFDRNEISKQFFISLNQQEQKRFIDWIYKAKKKETQEKRVIAILERLRAKRRSPN